MPAWRHGHRPVSGRCRARRKHPRRGPVFPNCGRNYRLLASPGKIIVANSLFGALPMRASLVAIVLRAPPFPPPAPRSPPRIRARRRRRKPGCRSSPPGTRDSRLTKARGCRWMSRQTARRSSSIWSGILHYSDHRGRRHTHHVGDGIQRAAAVLAGWQVDRLRHRPLRLRKPVARRSRWPQSARAHQGQGRAIHLRMDA